MNASRPQKTLKPNQRFALLALASGERPRLVAARAGISVPTLYRWRRDPVFQQALDAALDNYHENFPPGGSRRTHLRLPGPHEVRPIGGTARPDPRRYDLAQIPRPPESSAKVSKIST